jgi:hypothetical protein
MKESESELLCTDSTALMGRAARMEAEKCLAYEMLFDGVRMSLLKFITSFIMCAFTYVDFYWYLYIIIPDQKNSPSLMDRYSRITKYFLLLCRVS